MRGQPSRVRGAVGGALVVSLLAAAGCEITEQVLAPAQDLVVAEALVQLRDDLDGQRILVFLHRTVSGGRSVAVPGASGIGRTPARIGWRR